MRGLITIDSGRVGGSGTSRGLGPLFRSNILVNDKSTGGSIWDDGFYG